MPIAERGEFKGHTLLVLKKDKNDKYGFSFGVEKAKLVLESIDLIRAFVKAETGSAPADDGDV